MKKTLGLLLAILFTANMTFACDACKLNKENNPINANENCKKEQIILDIHKKTSKAIKAGSGPFYAVIYDNKGNIVVEAANSVVKDECCLYHAEVNAIKAACAKYKTYDLSPYNLSIYINAEPCIMCAGAIMWSGIKNVYYSVPSKEVERITGFDEGFKPRWHEEFAKRGITVEGNIKSEAGKAVMKEYMTSGKTIYKPSR